MRILLLTENWPPRVGGIENYLTHIAQGLPRDSVSVVAPKPSLGRELTGGGIHEVARYRFFSPWVRPHWLLLFMRLWQRVRKQPPDVLLCGKALFEARAAYYLHMHVGIPYVVFTYAMELTAWSSAPRTLRQLRQVLDKACRVVYINDQSGRLLCDLGVREEQLVKIWPGVDDNFFTAVTDAEKKQTQEMHGIAKQYVVSVGRLVARKGFDTLIAGYAKVNPDLRRDYALVIVGAGEELEMLRKQARELGVGQDVIFVGAVNDDELRALYSGAACFALTPRQIDGATEGFGIVYLEAAAQGLAALGTNHGGITEAVLDRQTGVLIPPDDSVACGAALSELLGDRVVRERLGSQGKERAWREFRWSKRILLVKGMLDAILAERVLAKLRAVKKE